MDFHRALVAWLLGPTALTTRAMRPLLSRSSRIAGVRSAGLWVVPAFLLGVLTAVAMPPLWFWLQERRRRVDGVRRCLYPDLNEAATPACDALRRRLKDCRVDLELTAAPLPSALVELRRGTGIPIAPDRAGLALIQASPVRLRLSLKETSAMAALNLMLAEVPNLISLVESDRVRVTDLRVISEPSRLEVYPVQDIVSSEPTPGVVSVAPEKLQELVERTLGDEPETCVDYASANFETEIGAHLLLRAPTRLHRKVIGLLRTLRGDPPADPSSAVRSRLRTATVTLQATAERVDRVLRAWAEQAGVAVSLDVLMHTELSAVTVAVTDLEAGAVLELIAEQSGLRVSIVDETVTLLPCEAAPLDASLRFYRVDDILADYRDRPEPRGCVTVGGGPAEPEPRSLPVLDDHLLVSLIIEATGDRGEPASIEVHRNHLIVCQTPEMHTAVERVLARLRQHRWVYPNPRHQPAK